MAKPISTLVIGMGGSGGWTTVHVKRQLMDAYQNRIPDNVGLIMLDTARYVIIGLGSEDSVKREPGMGVGRVEIGTHEYAHVGGDVFELSNRIANNVPGHEHFRDWFLADWYLSNLQRSQFQLETGAGQYRQFGRIALFNDVANPNTSKVDAIINSRLVELAEASEDRSRSIAVMLVGSMAGGTGAGLFMDIPHLIRRVAEHRNINVSLRAFLYLPQAFQGVIGPGELVDAKARAFAAMRELKRFIMNEDYQFGYPMFYHSASSGVNTAIWRARMTGKLFDFVYLIDGSGNNLNARPLKEGVASAVADAIVSFIDPNYGQYRQEIENNLRNRVTQRQQRIGKRAFVSTLGSYSIILPIEQIIEGWSHRMALDFMARLVPAAEDAVDERGYVSALSHMADPLNANGDVGGEVRRLLRQQTPMVDPKDPNRQLAPMPLWREAIRIQEEYEINEGATRQDLLRYQLGHWLTMLIPQSEAQADRTMRDAMRETASILHSYFHQQLLPTEKDRPSGDPNEIPTYTQEARRFIDDQLGQVAAGGGRRGGRYRHALERFVDLQIVRLREYMVAYLLTVLNGYAVRNEVEKKTGKLGWLLAVVERLHYIFGSLNELLENVRSGYRSEMAAAHRGMVEQSLSDGERELREAASTGRRKLRQAQENYIHRVQSYVDFYRTEFAREAVTDTVRQIYAFLEELRDELIKWRDLLVTNQQSLYTRLIDGRNRVASERRRTSRYANHRLIGHSDNPQEQQNYNDWEENKYRQYMTEEVYESMFKAWEWDVGLITGGGGTLPFLAARIGDVDITSDYRGNWSQQNSEAMLGFARTTFREATQRLSVLGYLSEMENATEVGEELARNANALLSLQAVEITNPNNFLLAFVDESDTYQGPFLDEALRSLISAQGRGGAAAQGTGDTMNETVQTHARFRLTLLSTVDVIDVEGTIAYQENEDNYWGMPYDSRELAHIFPAEVRAVKYEKDLSDLLQQHTRPLSDRVIFLLENEERFLEFMLLRAHGIVNFISETVGNRYQYAWVLEMPTTDNRRSGEMDKWYLTQRGDMEQSMLGALIQYVLKGADSLNPNRKIPYQDVSRYLEVRREEQTTERANQNMLAVHFHLDENGEYTVDPETGTYSFWFDEELRGWIEPFMPPVDEEGYLIEGAEWYQEDQDELMRVAKEVVRIDLLTDLVDMLKVDLPVLGQRVAQGAEGLEGSQRHDAIQRAQEEYDLYSVIIIALQNEIATLRSVVKEMYTQKVGR